jgi:hypothetical protein
MKRIIIFLAGLSGVSILAGDLTHEKYTYIKTWFQYTVETAPSYPPVTSVDPIPAPVLGEYPDAAAQLDSLIVDLRIDQKTLDWALDSLRPSNGPVSQLSDELRRVIIYYLYVDQLEALDKPLRVKYLCGKRDLFICGGAGTPEKGFLELACLTGVCDGFEYGGPLVVSWAATTDTVMGSTRAFEVFNRAAKQGIFVSLFDNPKWSKPSSVVRCAAPFYGRPAYRIRAGVEYDHESHDEANLGSIVRRRDSYYVFAFVKGGYEYLVAFMAEGGCFDPENLADFLSLRP